MGVRLTWIAVALSKDIPPGVAVPSHVMDQELVVWRSASGQIKIWNDRCPHRGMRLSHGFVRGETLNCIYHGWQYGATGGCTYIPAHPELEPPKTIATTVHSALEQDGIVWKSMAATDVPPPDLTGWIAVRTLPVSASQAKVETCFGGKTGLIVQSDNAILIQPVSEVLCNIHGLTRGDLKAASHWLEAQRREIEASL